MLDFKTLRPIQAMAASIFFKHRRLMLCLPRQFGGKTELGCRLGKDFVDAYDHRLSWLFLAKSAPARKKATREKFMRIFDRKDYVVNTEIIYPKKRPANQILMGSVDKDPDSIRGGTNGGFHWAEVAFSKLEHGESITDVFLKIVKPTGTLIDGYGLMESTTNGKNGWYDIWNSAHEFGFKKLLISFSQMLEMGLVSQEVYDKQKSETLPLIFRQEFECEFVTFQGLVYEEFHEDIHVQDVAPPEEWQRTICAIDWGFSPSATAVLFGYVRDDTIYIFDESYETKQLLEDTYVSIMARLSRWNIVNFAATADHDLARIEELNRRGISCGQAKKANVLGNRIEVKERFWKNKIVIDPRCKFLIRDLVTATWHERIEGELDYTQCTYGHFDSEAALRYLVRELSAFEQEAPEINPHIGLDEASAREWEARREYDAFEG